MIVSEPLPVLIIGSGLGGLTLAHALAKHNIPYRIYERDSQESQRAQGYRITIADGGADGLRSALSTEMYDRFESTCADKHPPVGRLDGPSGRVLGRGVPGLVGAGGWAMVWALCSRLISKRWSRWTWTGQSEWMWSWFGYISASHYPVIPAGGRKHVPVDRRVLRSLLLTDQSSLITYESAFTSYTTSPTSVTAHFANGTFAIGSLLVGADGVRSKVAAQLIGDLAEPQDLGYRIAYGKTYLTPEVEQRLHPSLQKGVSCVTDTTAKGHRLFLVLEAMRFTRSGATEDYMFWAMAAKKEAFDEEDEKLLAMQGQAAADLSLGLTANWDPRIQIIFDKQAVDETAVLRVLGSNPEHTATWRTDRRVTVLGDAIHCMPPTGGQGANSAIYDAALLGSALGQATEDGHDGWSVETIGSYEDAMRYNIGDIVGLACIGATYVIGGGK